MKSIILTGHQPAYLPWLGLFHKIALSDTYFYLDTVQYLVKEFNNRNKVKIVSGPVWLTVPVKTREHRNKLIKDIEIDNSVPWKRKHWNTIYLNYKKAPFFHEYADFFEDVYKKPWEYLTELNEYMLRWLLKELGINTRFVKTSNLSIAGHKSDLVLNICQELSAGLYIFGAMGRDYAKMENFKSQDIAVHFQDYKHPRYPQLHGDFVSHMSVVDLLFNCGRDSLNVLMSGNIKREELITNYKLYK